MFPTRTDSFVENVPLGDKKVKEIVTQKGLECPNYTEEKFLKVFEKYFEISDKQPVADTKRTLYLMRVKE